MTTVHPDANVVPGADVEPGSQVGLGTTVWPSATVRSGATLGANCVVGRGAYVDCDVSVADNVKLENYALLYRPALVEKNVFIGPGAILTNDLHPRSTTVDGVLKGAADWDAVGVVVREGASVGARVVILGGVTIGRWAMLGAGAVVTRDVPDFALVVGSPARQIGWVGPSGRRLQPMGGGKWLCPASGAMFALADGVLRAEA